MSLYGLKCTQLILSRFAKGKADSANMVEKDRPGFHGEARVEGEVDLCNALNRTTSDLSKS